MCIRDRDTDGDGIFNHLDNDSDGDGCPDAIEGGDDIILSQLDSNSEIIGAQDSNGVPLLVFGNQSSPIDVIDNSITIQCPCKHVRTNRHISRTIRRN